MCRQLFFIEQEINYHILLSYQLLSIVLLHNLCLIYIFLLLLKLAFAQVKQTLSKDMYEYYLQSLK